MALDPLKIIGVGVWGTIWYESALTHYMDIYTLIMRVSQPNQALVIRFLILDPIHKSCL
mgnify:CR=1 FL=1